MAKFVQLKVTDYRLSLDTFRIRREAKLFELVYPFVKYARQNNIKISLEMFFNVEKSFMVEVINTILYMNIKRCMELVSGYIKQHLEQIMKKCQN